jgi:hypothetical protein
VEVWYAGKVLVNISLVVSSASGSGYREVEIVHFIQGAALYREIGEN